MKTITPKEFINQVLIEEVGEIHSKHPYISFATMAIGIEFLGKCLNDQSDWNYFTSGQPRKDFEAAINQLNSFSIYRPYLSSHNFWDALRNGFTHSFVPKGPITLSSKDEMGHMIEHDGKLNLKCEDFYLDFKAACKEILQMTFHPNNKMNLPLLDVPDETDKLPKSGTTIPSITTEQDIPVASSNSTAVTGTTACTTFTHYNKNK